MPRTLSYFVSDVHLGLEVSDPALREARFVAFLQGIPAAETESLYLLGDIWDFWYEYRDVVPKGYVRVFSALQELMDGGVKVYFCPGNHDVWTYRYFAELGMTILQQPYVAEIGGKAFCLGHGDCLGPVSGKEKFLRGVFHSRFLQRCFSSLHPRIAFALGNGWSRRNRLSHKEPYVFRGEEEPLYQFCRDFNTRVDYFIFGHYHTTADIPVGNARLMLLGDWFDNSNWLVFDASSSTLRREVIG